MNSSPERNQNGLSEDRPKENIQVCVRMRPLLEPYEDEVAWEIDKDHKIIKSRQNLKS